MTTWKITLNSPWFEYVKLGVKKYEGRCFHKEVCKYQVGDTLNISHHTNKNENSFDVIITDILHFNTFENAINNIGIDTILPNIETIEDGIDIYLKFVKLSTQLANGIVMIKIDIMKG